MYVPISNPTANANLITYYSMNTFIPSGTVVFDDSKEKNHLIIGGSTITTVSEFIDYTAVTESVNSSVQNTTTTVGNLTFDDATANGNDPFDAPVEITVAKITGAPNVTTGITEPNTDNKYYIVQLYDGAGTYSVDLSIASPFPNGSAVTLYRRDDNSIGAWTVLASGTVVGGKAIFTNITSFSQLMMASATALPVELLSFTAIADIEVVKLNWSVGIEDNLSHYEIERSTNGRDFEHIGAVSAKDLSFYKFQDFDISNNNIFYYRLKAVDLDDSYEYSNIINITLEESNNQAINIYPNPVVGDFVNINVESQNATISIHDNTGKLIRSYQSTNNTFQINISNLSSGLYYISINTNGVQTVRKLIVE
jgi:hypothetical protein